ncbi:MAG: bifunctional demethylmenaquinone methyltransferase/2-methoxy-6-polyprenyl-1,4-benzoquinol methylase UbiE [Leptolyngbya sp. PLA2]|nr:bifunctional demethylmenaquinone methyltransferase/2-methoxy-6-polyprenyl-1,4-benzoquinol methylase UbiE [Leptolyngbya sp. PL-A2]MCQ3940093.1 bifunctional demethylmenaquinone methyltransferase/2-methoxy-6-polyprenyl-1,4-benzoquinol methylase UbiE [cyanobacterium CYA1]MCZ7632785.1 bifunctional demethylmenaquinone methyltransferase/2-methoxy-6-polyprenyl-1,4-benzoquinol methylase UbiE [Phycisphaerales bacterium]MDL1904170.1 bifunctional demethylmenaquinone methyltransferase/2-methoxy-6-polypren
MNHLQPTHSADAAPPQAWTDAELADPHANPEKAERVRRMFAAIARSYDLNNRLHSFGRDQAWRRHAVRAAGVRSGDAVLDVACGTGDLTLLFAQTEAARVVGLDFTPEMLDLANAKRARLATSVQPEFIRGDAQNLPFDDASFDVVSIAFGIRNVQRPEQAIAEFARVLRPGGRLVILEFGQPGFAPIRWLNNFYCGWVMPRTATLISRDRSGAYRYLPRSIGSFMPRLAMLDLLNRSGFRDGASTPLTFGVCVCYRAVRVGA